MPVTPQMRVIPADVRAAMLGGLSSFRLFNSADSVLKQDLLAATEGLDVFTLGVPDVLPSGSGLKGAAESGWRIAVANPRTALAADIYTMPRGGDPPLPAGTARLACVRQSPEITAMLDTFNALSTPPLSGQLPSEAFEVRVLILPGLFTEALWLLPESSGSSSSFVVPYYTLVEGMSVKVAYSETSFLAHLGSVAAEWASYGKTLARNVSSPI